MGERERDCPQHESVYTDLMRVYDNNNTSKPEIFPTNLQKPLSRTYTIGWPRSVEAWTGLVISQFVMFFV